MAKFKIDLQGKEEEIEAIRQGNSIHLTLEGRSYDLQLLQQKGPAFVFNVQLPNGTHNLIRAAGQTQGDSRQMWVNGRNFHFSRLRERGSGSRLDESLSSAIPAVVSKILAVVGEEVAEGDKLILLESMKMVIPIQAPRAGVISAIHCAEGDSIQAGRPLIELERTK